MEFSILILFQSWLITFSPQNACIHLPPPPSGKKPLFEGKSRWREDIGDRAECDLTTGHRLASD